MDTRKLYDFVTIAENGCWDWMRALNNKGYAVCYVAGRQTLAHRTSYEVSKGQIPIGVFVLHECDNPKCINPDHLFLGTQIDNMQDCKAKGRMSKPPPNPKGRNVGRMPRGESLWNQTLTEAEARDIMRLHMEHLNISQIASRLNKPKHIVADVCRGRSWRWLDDIPTVDQLKTGGVRRGFNQFS
jgi:HNH endonuclease